MNVSISGFSFALFFVLLLALAHKTHGLDSCSSALEPIFTGAQGHRCVQLTITTASASTSAVRLLASFSLSLSRFFRSERFGGGHRT
jgi:hypothetical protein